MQKHLPESIDSLEQLQALVVSGFTDWKNYGDVLVKIQDDLIMFSYSAEAQYKATWNFFEVISRGLILNRNTGEIVARPFDKFYNWLEGGRRANGHIVMVTEKLDGSLGILYRTAGGYRLGTRGSFGSEQALWGTQFLHDYFDLTGLPNELTLLFEMIYPSNRIVVDYEGREDLVLLAARNRFTGAYLPFFPDVYNMGQQYGFSLPQVYQFNSVTDIIVATDTLPATHEGWVVEFSDGSRFKFKGDRYKELHRLVTGLTFNAVLKAMEAGTIHYLLNTVPDEFLDEVKGWIAAIEATIAEMKARVRAVYETAPQGNRKEFALWARATHVDLQAYLFAMLDEKPLEPLIYKLVEFQAPP